MSIGRIDLGQFGATIVRRHADLVSKTDQKVESATMALRNTKKNKKDYQAPLVSKHYLFIYLFMYLLIYLFIYLALLSQTY